MWDLPGPGLEPVSPALAGGFLTTAPPENSLVTHSFNHSFKTLSLNVEMKYKEKYKILQKFTLLGGA